MDLSVIVVSYNTRQLLDDCLSRLLNLHQFISDKAAN